MVEDNSSRGCKNRNEPLASLRILKLFLSTVACFFVLTLNVLLLVRNAFLEHVRG